MKKAVLCLVATLAFAAPASAQVRFNSMRSNSNPAMVRVPPSSLPGAGLSGSATSSLKSAYPKPIKREYDPNFFDPTDRNAKLRK